MIYFVLDHQWDVIHDHHSGITFHDGNRVSTTDPVEPPRNLISLTYYSVMTGATYKAAMNAASSTDDYIAANLITAVESAAGDAVDTPDDLTSLADDFNVFVKHTWSSSGTNTVTAQEFVDAATAVEAVLSIITNSLRSFEIGVHTWMST